jgi:hypothetical protein
MSDCAKPQPSELARSVAGRSSSPSHCSAVGFFALSHEFLSSRPELWSMMGTAGEHLSDAMKLLRRGDKQSRDHAEAIAAFMANPLNSD